MTFNVIQYDWGHLHYSILFNTVFNSETETALLEPLAILNVLLASNTVGSEEWVRITNVNPGKPSAKPVLCFDTLTKQ